MVYAYPLTAIRIGAYYNKRIREESLVVIPDTQLDSSFFLLNTDYTE